MTERLKSLLRDEADRLDVPASPAGAVLQQGRRQRRRRTAGLAFAAVATAGALGAGGLLLGGLGDGDRDTAPDPSATVGDNAVFAIGNRIYYDGPEQIATIDDKATKSLFYTSAGVLVRHGNNSASDGGGPQRFSLVAPDGTVTRLGLVTEETVHASDVAQPFVAYVETVGQSVEAVVYDVVKDAEAARVRLPGAPAVRWYPVSLSGDTLYAQAEEQVYEVAWRKGTAEPADVAQSAWDVKGGLQATQSGRNPAVRDMTSGEVVLQIEGHGMPDLSPDGRYAMLADNMGETNLGKEIVVYEVATGESVTIAGPGDAFAWGWTADGDLFRVDNGTVVTCSSSTGACTDEEAPTVPKPEEQCEVDGGERVCLPGYLDVRLGGRVYES